MCRKKTLKIVSFVLSLCMVVMIGGIMPRQKAEAAVITTEFLKKYVELEPGMTESLLKDDVSVPSGIGISYSIKSGHSYIDITRGSTITANSLYGSAVVTVSLISDEGRCTVDIPVEVLPLKSGDYYMSTANSPFCMTAKDGDTTPGAKLTCWLPSNSFVEQDNYRLWRVKYVGCGYYTIRCSYMPNLAVAIGEDNGVTTIFNDVETESTSTVPEEALWYISKDTSSKSSSQYYKIWSKKSMNRCLATKNSINEGEEVYTALWGHDYRNDSAVLWKFNEYVDHSISISTNFLKKYVDVEWRKPESILKDGVSIPSDMSLTYSVKLGIGDISISDTGIIIAKRIYGSAIVAVKWESKGYSGTIYVPVEVTPLKDGNYYMNTASSPLCMTVKNGDMTPGATLTCWMPNSSLVERDDYRLWRVKYLGNGYYTIRCSYMPNLAVAIGEDNGITTIFNDVETESTSTVPEEALWHISVSDEFQYYRIQPQKTLRRYLNGASGIDEGEIVRTETWLFDGSNESMLWNFSTNVDCLIQNRNELSDNLMSTVYQGVNESSSSQLGATVTIKEKQDINVVSYVKHRRGECQERCIGVCEEYSI